MSWYPFYNKSLATGLRYVQGVFVGAILCFAGMRTWVEFAGRALHRCWAKLISLGSLLPIHHDHYYQASRRATHFLCHSWRFGFFLRVCFFLSRLSHFFGSNIWSHCPRPPGSWPAVVIWWFLLWLVSENIQDWQQKCRPLYWTISLTHDLLCFFFPILWWMSWSPKSVWVLKIEALFFSGKAPIHISHALYRKWPGSEFLRSNGQIDKVILSRASLLSPIFLACFACASVVLDFGQKNVFVFSVSRLKGAFFIFRILRIIFLP